MVTGAHNFNKHKANPKNHKELIAATEKAYVDQNKDIIGNVFLSLQGAMIDSLAVDGSNRYKLRHMGKGKLRKKGELPTSLPVDPILIARGREKLEGGVASLTVRPATAQKA